MSAMPETLGDLWDMTDAERALAERVRDAERHSERDRLADEVTDEQLSNATDTVERLIDLAHRAGSMRVGEIRSTLAQIVDDNRFESSGVRYRTY